MYQVKYKIWIDEGGIVFGRGAFELLKNVKGKGSLTEAARDMGMSYNKAYTLIKRIEKRLGFRLIESKSGGSRGGSSQLTEQAEKLVAIYENFYNECEISIKQIFEKYFEGLSL